jgi:hypothetical protein
VTGQLVVAVEGFPTNLHLKIYNLKFVIIVKNILKVLCTNF